MPPEKAQRTGETILSDTIVILVLLVVLAVAVFAGSFFVPPTKHYWQGLFSELGKFDAQRFERRRAKKRRQRQQRREEDKSATAPPSDYLAGVAPPRPISAPTVISGRAAVVLVGTDASRLPLQLRSAAAEWSRSVHPPGADEWREDAGGAERRLLSDIAAAVAAAACEVREGRLEHIAIVLDPPISGHWGFDNGLDLARLFGTCFGPRDCPVWLTYREPLDPSPWPQETYLEAATTPDQLIARLASAGLKELEIARPPVVGRAVRLPPDVAARALLLLAGLSEGGETPPFPEGFPPYAAYLNLAIDTGDPMAVTSALRQVPTLARELQEFMEEEGLRLTEVAGAAGDVLPLTPYRGEVVAWRAATQPGPAPEPTQVAEEQEADLTTETLERAITANDERLAAAILAWYGRAWIETPRAGDYLDVLERTREKFPPDSAAALWGEFLIGLDAALRLGEPDPERFGEEACRRARPHGLEALFRAERMELTRLRGDLGAAVALSKDVVDVLAGDGGASDAGPVYSRATARYVLANLLRRGGRYDLARREIAQAREAYDLQYPSHAVEEMHCRYGIAVCETVQGVPRVDPVEPAPAGRMSFARALVTLANAQAAWFVQDYSRARHFAVEAGSTFADIEYGRYAQRAQRVGELVTLWEALSEGRSADNFAEELSLLIVAGIEDETKPLDLSLLRPSAALTVLEFLDRFADPSASRQIQLPRVIVEAQSGYELGAEVVAASVADADELLRGQMGIGKGTPVPLLPD